MAERWKRAGEDHIGFLGDFTEKYPTTAKTVSPILKYGVFRSLTLPDFYRSFRRVR